MAFSMLENVVGRFCYLNGERIAYDSEVGRSLFLPVEETIYYESIRVLDGVMLFFEDHMLRLYSSIEKEQRLSEATVYFPDAEQIYAMSVLLIQDDEHNVRDGNLRVVICGSRTLIYLSDMKLPLDADYQNGVVTVTLSWERVSPQVKVFRGDYKAAVAKKLETGTPQGVPYEVLLTNSAGEITEGGRSNFFVLLDNVVYSPPEELILIGITRKYVQKAIREAGFSFEERLFTLAEILRLRGEGAEPVLFLTSSPFDILPVRFVDNVEVLDSGGAELTVLERIRQAYRKFQQGYIYFHSPELPDE